jgi:hypothetical protein
MAQAQPVKATMAEAVRFMAAVVAAVRAALVLPTTQRLGYSQMAVQV